MTKKQKNVTVISISLNIILIACVIWGYSKMNFVKDQVILTEVQRNLVELEGLIDHQKKNNWSEPNSVTTKMGDILNGIWLGRTTGRQLGTFSKTDQEILSDLYSKLNQFPSDEIYQFADLTEEDKENFEELQKSLREVGLGMRITIKADRKYFMSQAEKLSEKIEVPLK
ncbi:MAG TPA: hypothetical protein VE710_18580 [Candidatus Bathyarchaeia archaeon]|nr:hypothetical protein [Candidatus Bathyarchaeia archaeon]